MNSNRTLDCIALYVPGYKPAYIESALSTTIKNIILCLEDGTPEDKKVEGRYVVKHTLKEYRLSGKTFIVRINGVGTDYWKEDLEQILEYAPHRIRIPMVKGVDDIKSVDNYIAQLKPDSQVKYEVMIENRSALQSMNEIHAYTNKVYAFTIGGEDFYEDIKKCTAFPDIEIKKAKLAIAQFCKQNNLYSFDTTFMDYADEEGFLKDCIKSRNIGFFGRSIIHPVQAKLALQVYGN